MAITEEQKAAVEEHNRVRRRYGSPDLEWDDQLAYDAWTWAKKLADDDTGSVHATLHNQAECIAEWQDGFQTGPFGSNYYALGANRWWDKNRMSDWSEAGPGEEEIFHNQPDANYLQWGHFAIMKSPGFSKMGIWWARAASGNIYIVGRYSGSMSPPAFDTNEPTKRF